MQSAEARASEKSTSARRSLIAEKCRRALPPGRVRVPGTRTRPLRRHGHLDEALVPSDRGHSLLAELGQQPIRLQPALLYPSDRGAIAAPTPIGRPATQPGAYRVERDVAREAQHVEVAPDEHRVKRASKTWPSCPCRRLNQR